ncbi:hypothetical protein ACHAXH_008629 [Discostella pseudostelligera]
MNNPKYQGHGSVSSRIQRWMALNGKFIVVLALACFLSVFILPPFQVLTSKTVASLVPPCDRSPWKPNEDLRGKCPGDLKPYELATTVSDCASSCCADDACITWQYRRDVGCLHGPDVRIGMEKDGTPAWCSDHPPQRWQGQYLIPHKEGQQDHEKLDAADVRKSACDSRTWNPEEQIGQCFGLGDVRKDASGSAEECMRACCDDKECNAWQWTKELGCFYGGGMHGCQKNADPIAFEPFIGRRKLLDSRQYTDAAGKPWQMKMK